MSARSYHHAAFVTYTLISKSHCLYTQSSEIAINSVPMSDVRCASLSVGSMRQRTPGDSQFAVKYVLYYII